jgi:hypothetical protein
MSREFALSADIYTLAAIERAAQDFSQLCTVAIEPGHGEIRVRFTPIVSRQDLMEEFLNYVLGLSAAELLST